jgi:hypothetical protein
VTDRKIDQNSPAWGPQLRKIAGYRADQAKRGNANKLQNEVSGMKTPDMTGKAADITDPMWLYERIGYRTYLIHKAGPGGNKFQESWRKSELRRLLELEQAERAEGVNGR